MYLSLSRRFVQCISLFCILNLVLVSCSHPQATLNPSNNTTQAYASGSYWPTQGWRTSSPEQQGMASEQLDQMLAEIQQKNLNLHSLLIVRNGYLVSETYFASYQQTTRHELYSCTKSFISTLIGIAMDKKLIDRLDHPILDYFPERTFANLDSQKQAMTLANVLTMRSGLDWQEGDPTYRAMYQSQDWVKYVLDEPMAQSPGSQFNYCSGCTHLLSAILQKAAGINTRDFAEQNLFKPLGISNVNWDTDSTGIPIGGWGLQLAPRDMAKLGYLFLRNGEWDGQQIVSSTWVKNATQKQTAADGDLGYGYQWWTYPSLAAYTALGRFGQTIFVIPASDLVIVTTAQMENHDDIFHLIERYIVPAVRKSQ